MGHVAIYPGSFDPITLGHIDIITRSAKYFDTLIVCVATNIDKHPLFSVEERLSLVEKVILALPNVRVIGFSGLIISAAKDLGATAIVRGLRTFTDYEYELPMAQTNKDLNPDIETFFIMADPRHSYTSSRLVKEAFKFGGDISKYVPAHVLAAFMNKANVSQDQLARINVEREVIQRRIIQNQLSNIPKQ